MESTAINKIEIPTADDILNKLPIEYHDRFKTNEFPPHRFYDCKIEFDEGNQTLSRSKSYLFPFHTLQKAKDISKNIWPKISLYRTIPRFYRQFFSFKSQMEIYGFVLIIKSSTHSPKKQIFYPIDK